MQKARRQAAERRRWRRLGDDRQHHRKAAKPAAPQRELPGCSKQHREGCVLASCEPENKRAAHLFCVPGHVFKSGSWMTVEHCTATGWPTGRNSPLGSGPPPTHRGAVAADIKSILPHLLQTNPSQTKIGTPVEHKISVFSAGAGKQEQQSRRLHHEVSVKGGLRGGRPPALY